MLGEQAVKIGRHLADHHLITGWRLMGAVASGIPAKYLMGFGQLGGEREPFASAGGPAMQKHNWLTLAQTDISDGVIIGREQCFHTCTCKTVAESKTGPEGPVKQLRCAWPE